MLSAFFFLILSKERFISFEVVRVSSSCSLVNCRAQHFQGSTHIEQRWYMLTIFHVYGT